MSVPQTRCLHILAVSRRVKTMARMHSGSKGKSGSKKPIDKTVPAWTTHKPKEVEMLVVKFAKSGMSASQIGIMLRDTYGIPSVHALAGKSINSILAEKELSPELPEDLNALIKKNIAVRKHLEANKVDRTAKRGLQLTEAKINRLIRYYKQTGKLSADWKFDPSRAAMYLE